MGTQVNLGVPAWLDGPNYNGLDLRQFSVMATGYATASSGALVSRGGVRNQPAAGAVAASSGMTVTCDGFSAVVPNSTSSTNGAYQVTSMSRQNLTLTASDPVNPRIDLIVAYVQDLGNSSSAAYVGTVDGTPAASPSAPSAPSNSITLAQIAVAANAASITSGNITDKRAYTAAPGSIIYTASTSVAPAGVNGQYCYDAANDRIYHAAASGAKQARTLPFSPGFDAHSGSNVTLPFGTETTICTVNVTTDGSTDLRICYKWCGVFQTSPAQCQVRFRVYIDSTPIDTLYGDTSSVAAASQTQIGGGATYRTSSLLGTTPSAGAHTITFKCLLNTNAGGTTSLDCTNGPAILDVSAVPL